MPDKKISNHKFLTAAEIAKKLIYYFTAID